MKNKSSIDLLSIKKNQQIVLVLKKGHQVHCETFKIWWIKTPTNHIEFALLVNKSIFKLAVLRNHIKRQWRMMLRQTSGLTKGLKILIKPNANYCKKKFHENFILFQKIINQINKGGTNGE